MAQSLNPSDAQSWYQFVTNFDATYATFYDNYNALMALGPYIQTNHPELLDEYEANLQMMSDDANTLEELKATRDYVYSWLQWLQTGATDVTSFVGSAAQSAYQSVMSTFGFNGFSGRGMHGRGLGVIPVLVAVVGIAAAAAILVAVANDLAQIYTFAQRVNALQAQEANGATPEQAAAIVNQTMGPPGSNEFLGIPWEWLALAAVAIFLGPPLLKMIDRGRE